MLNDPTLETPLKSNHEIIIVSPLPIRPLHSTPKANVEGITKEQEEDARSELLEIMTPSSKRRESHHHPCIEEGDDDDKKIVDVPASPVYRTLNPLPHDTSFIHAAAAFLTVQNAMAAMAAAVNDNHYSMDTTTMNTTTTTTTSNATTTTTRTRSYSVGDDRNKIPAIVC